MGKKSISVVIPNYNGRKLLTLILPALYRALEKSSIDHEVIIADDASTDDSIAFIEKNYPRIRLLINTQNQGFSPTINKGIFLATKELVLLLNSDVKLMPDYFEPLFRYFDKADTFGVMGRIIGWDDDRVQDAAKYPSFHGAKIKTSGNYYAKDPNKNDWLLSMYLSGANALVDREKLVALNGFNEIYAPFYVEDFELSIRAWRLGWNCYYEHFAICRHQQSVSIKAKNKKKAINTIYYRNKMYLHATHLSGLQKFLWYLQLFPEILIRLLTFRFYYLTAYFMFISQNKKLLNSIREFKLFSKSKNIHLCTVKDVVNKILESIRNKNIVRF